MLGWFAETTLVATALAAVAALAGRVRPIGPTARHILWLAVLVKMMTPPLVAWPWAVAWHDLQWPPLPTREEPVGRSPAVETGDDAMPPMTPRPIAAIEDVPADLPIPDHPIPRHPTRGSTVHGAWMGFERTLITGWLLTTGLLATGQVWRILRFRRRLRMAVPAPDDLVEEAERIAEQLGGRVPEVLVVPELGSPMLWCLGRPKLLLPAALVKTIGRDRWRGILAHELAHLRRGDHWVSRLELLAGLLWWWNPLYWLTRARLDAEAELACDAWVVWALPKDRLAYAETLFDIGSRLSRAVSPAPALGAAGSGRFLERRLTMILREHVPCRLSPSVLLAAVLLVLFAIPSWSAITPAAEPPAVPASALAAPADQGLHASFADDDDDDDDDAADDEDDDDDDDDDNDDDDDDDDDDADRAKLKAEAKAKQDEARAKRDEARAKRAEAKAKAEAKPQAKAKSEGKKGDFDIQIEIEKFGPEFEKKMEAFSREIEAKLGPGSDFEKQMKKLGKELEGQLGPGSDFEKQMKKLGEELKTKLGPGSDFEKQMREMGEKMKERVESAARKGAEAETDVKRAEDRLEWASKMRQKGYVSDRTVEAEAAKLKEAKEVRAKAGAEKEKPKVKVTAKGRRRDARIAALEAQIRKLSEELKALEADEDEDER
jgi:beta-lactamase regulating signal transducer with metallopeptidase domain